MTPRPTHPQPATPAWALLALAPPLLWWVAQPRGHVPIDSQLFLFGHTAMELMAVTVALLVFVTGHRAMASTRSGCIQLLGHAFLGVAALDFLHALSYAGMPGLGAPNSPQKSIIFWLWARTLAALALLTYVARLRGPDISFAIRRRASMALFTVVALLALLGLAVPERLPTVFTPGQGLTALKIGWEWLLVLLHMLSLLLLWRARRSLAPALLWPLAFVAGLSVASELFLTLLRPADQEGANALGHLYKLAAYGYLFKATFDEALRQPLEAIQAQELRERIMLNAAPDGVVWVDQNGCIISTNPAMEALSGYPVAELVGNNVALFLPGHLRERHADNMRAFFRDPQARGMSGLDLKLTRRDGSQVPVDIALGHWAGAGQTFAVAYVRDMTGRKELEASLRHQASHDELTGLPNRWFFHLQLGQALVRAERARLQVAVLLLDLDHFKSVNDSFGHAVGDALLVRVAQRLRSALRENDTIARLGGDEFAILLTDLNNVDEAVNVAAKLMAEMQHPYPVAGHVLHSGGSLGLAFYPDDATDTETLLRYADMAMYQAKGAGRAGYACYSPQMDQQVREDMLLHGRLKEALGRGWLALHYQPQVDVRSNRVVGAEALLRWHDAELGPVPAARMVAVAEATGLIMPLSDWVLEQACRQIAAWHRQGTPLRVAVNFSAQQFRQKNLPERVGTVLARTGAPAHLLDIEITESVAMTQTEQARQQISALVALGCSVALDDFGTGYSSLAYLKALPVSKLKIDKAFMDGVPDDADDATLSRAIIALAHNLRLTLVAEGVETPAQLDFLRQHGCETYQGWLFSKALDAQGFGRYLDAVTPC